MVEIINDIPRTRKADKAIVKMLTAAILIRFWKNINKVTLYELSDFITFEQFHLLLYEHMPSRNK